MQNPTAPSIENHAQVNFGNFSALKFKSHADNRIESVAPYLFTNLSDFYKGNKGSIK